MVPYKDKVTLSVHLATRQRLRSLAQLLGLSLLQTLELALTELERVVEEKYIRYSNGGDGQWDVR